MKLNGNSGWITLAIFLAAQFGAGMWWASGISHDVLSMSKEVSSIKVDVECLKTRWFDYMKDRAGGKYVA